MKHPLISLLFFFSHFLFSQIPLELPPDYISHSDKGTVTLLATGFGDKKNASADAIESAFNALLFHGIAEAPKPKLRAPFLKKEKEVWEKFPDFLGDLFYKKGYLRYINEIGKPEKNKIKGLGNKKGYQLKLTINYETLLRDLRKEGLILQPGF